jgi:hypothetical protein
VKKIILFIFICSLGLAVAAQESTTAPVSKTDKKAEKRQRINAMIKQEEEGNLSFRKQSAFGLMLRTNGYGAFYELGKRRSPRWANLYTIEFSEIKNHKEDKIGGAENFFSNSYIFGKQNNFYQVKLGIGQQYILGQKGNKNGVAVTGSAYAGFDLGLMKPYYLQVIDSAGVDRTINYNDNNATFLDRGSIIGGAGFTKGWNSLKVKPGAFIKTSLRFDFGRYNERVQALEIGMSLEAFAQKIPILIFNDPKRLFYQGHIAFVFGSRKK